MLFPFTRVWTRRQKILVVASGLFVIVLSAALLYGYERYYRGRGEEMLYGTWKGGLIGTEAKTGLSSAPIIRFRYGIGPGSRSLTATRNSSPKGDGMPVGGFSTCVFLRGFGRTAACLSFGTSTISRHKSFG